MSKERKVYITGASGFVGINLVQYFSALEEYKPIAVNLRVDLPIFEQGAIVIHLAGKAHDLRNIAASDEYYEINTKLSQKVFDAFLASDASVFIFLSSVKAAADKVEGILTEEMVPQPATHYGKSKLIAEEYMLSSKVPLPKKLYVLRPCMIHGPGNKGNLNLLYKFVKTGIPFPLGAFRNRRSLLSIENLCFIIHSMISTEAPSGIYNAADDMALSTTEIITIIGECLGKRPIIWNIPPKSVRILAAICGVLRLPVNSERLDKLTENYIVDNTKIKIILKKPLPVEATDGLRRTIASFVHDNGR